MSQEFYKRNYHPLIILMFTSGMLDIQQQKDIPKTTKYNWKKIKHENYYGHEIAIDYINQFDAIKDVFASKFTFKALRLMLKTRSGYYQMLQGIQQKKKLLKDNAESIINGVDQIVESTNINRSTACRLYGISKDWYYAQKQKIVCTLNPFQKCYLKHPNQLAQNEVIIIENIVNDISNYGKTKTTLYYKSIRKGIINCGKSTFFKYANALGYKKVKRTVKPQKEFRASRIFEWLHVDITNVPTIEDGIQKVAFVKDNFSKAILHYSSIEGKAGSVFIANLFQETFEKYKLFEASKPINILSDGGSENKGQFLSWIK